MSDLEARYGASRRSSRTAENTDRAHIDNSKRWGIVAFVALLLGTVAFWAMTYANPDTTIETQTARFSPISETEASIQARVSVQPGTELACAFEALNDRKAVVGFKIIELPAADEQHQVVNLTLRTTQTADNVSVRECWIPED